MILACPVLMKFCPNKDRKSSRRKEFKDMFIQIMFKNEILKHQPFSLKKKKTNTT